VTVAGPRLAHEHALIVAAAREAGALALDFFKKGARSWDKKPDDPVSEADLAVDELLKRRLTGARPDYGWLSEETEDNPARLTRRRCWIVDPIDGTKAFLKGTPEFTVCVALVEDGRPIAGVVHNPATDEFYEATRGGGAFLNGRPIRPSAVRDVVRAHYLTGKRAFCYHDWPAPAEAFHHTWMNSIAYRMALVAEGRFDAAISLAGKSDWDIAAADLIVHEAGAKATTGGGETFVYNQASCRQRNLVAAGPALHAELMKILD